MKQNWRRAGFGVAIALAATAESASATDRALQHCLTREAEATNFSGVVSASHGGRLDAFLVRGRLAGSGSAPIDSRTRFNLGSASKMFTAVAVGQLIDAGKIGLDDKIGAAVKGLTPEASQVTVRQLLTHSSGLGDFFRPDNMAAMMAARTAGDLLPLIAEEKPAFAPGSRFAYSNSGFVLLGILIERVSGQSYGDYLARHVFAPAGMTRTGPDPKPFATLAVGMTAMGLDPGEAGVLHPAPGATEGYGSPAGGLFSTAEDMNRFAAALSAGRLTRPPTTAAFTAPQIVAAPAAASRPGRRYGMGFAVGSENGHSWFGHGGGTPGANAEFAVFPKERLTLTVLANRDPPMATTMFAYLRRLVLDPASRQTCGSPGD
jgi:CubicO group peptidase (beta-lactamase class C family)